ncbi:Crp/Fnr family transcriptional regulator [Pontibacillus sp. HMF3514]|uniref:Crp/Fnr family transcriptional regulator n=1 Tax=Pontibacillus sp. HMF3514 TaxID=2692425 RepID=UPI001F323D0E|nr:Crp/Fnr family transcriptional regulator [Pontibacillus sp. HMF3514]
MTERIQVLKQVPLFAELNEEDLIALQDITLKHTYHKKEYVFMEGEEREAVFFIHSGTIKTFKVDPEGKEQIINFLQAGDMFPHVGFFEETPYPATSEVMSEAVLFMIRIDDFNQFMLNHPEIAMKVMKILGQKISVLTQRIQEMNSQNVQHRVVYALIRLGQESGQLDKEEIYIDMPITNQDVANIVGSSRETINRVLNHLKKLDLIQVSRKGIYIKDINQLKEHVR